MHGPSEPERIAATLAGLTLVHREDDACVAREGTLLAVLLATFAGPSSGRGRRR